MATNLAKFQRDIIQDMINKGLVTNGHMADVAHYSRRTISARRGKLLRRKAGDLLKLGAQRDDGSLTIYGLSRATVK
jgi:hypothetical protein